MFQEEMKRTKRKSWEEFVTDEGNRDVWCFPYRFASGKVNQTAALSALRTDGSTTLNWSETANELLMPLLPLDYARNEIQRQREIRAQVKIEPEAPDIESFTERQVWDAIRKNKSGKSPGRDLIDFVVVKSCRELMPVLTRFLPV